jgi:hypothetical protein
MRIFFSGLTAVILLNILFVLPANAQSYGLAFNSHEVVQDKRTNLGLSLDNVSPKDNLEASFDLSFIPNRAIYFGYIMRLVGDDKQNIDLVYDNQANTRHFKIIVGERLSKISFNIDEKQLFGQWNKLRLLVDYKNDKITVTSGKEIYTEVGVHLQRAKNYKLLFGANAYRQFQTTDLPPIKLRDVKVVQAGDLIANWPLSEWEGNTANETVNQSNGTVTNPLWVKARHRNWSVEKELSMPGDASVAFDPSNEVVYIITPDSLVSFSVNKIPQVKTIAYASGKQLLVPGGQAIFANGKIYYLYVDQMNLGTYDPASQRWDKGFTNIATNNGHLNKFYNKADNSIYTVGGYGQLIYKDSVKRYDFVSNSWQKIKTKGDIFTPRYLAGLGTNATGDTAYVIGGYGSASGQQIVNPRNIYDMMRYTVKDQTFKKLFTIDVKKEDFAFANSLVINARDKSFYGLIFPQHKFNSSLQLMHGSLDKAAYTLVGDTIPYKFHDIHSYADVSYFPQSGQFLAVTLFKENDQTRIKIYSLLSPPEPLITDAAEAKHISIWVWVAVVFGLVSVAAVYLRKKRAVTPLDVIKPVAETAPAAVPQTVPEVIMEDEHNRNANNKNAIFLFGDLQLFTPDGNEITKYFTPLLKELFLVIVLYSIKLYRGVIT